nr:pyridoxal phosphate-dependent aminotransferase [uncultured Schaedlerella sp.]
MKTDEKSHLQLSDKVKSIPEALSVYINNLVYALKRRGDDIKVLSLGEAFFDIPMFPFEAIDFQRGYHYSESRGIPELRAIIADYYKQHYQARINPMSEVLISAGSKPLIYMAFQAILNRGDEVLIHEPAWLSYPEEIKLADGVPKFIPYDCPVEQFVGYMTEKTKMVVINNPNNPAGRIYAEEDLKTLYNICRPRGIYILIDEAYSDFIFDGNFVSMAKIVPDKDGIIVVNSLSKNLGISGWRVGYVISSPDVIYAILKLNQHLITCPASILLLYLSKYFEDIVKITLPQAREVVDKRNRIVSFMEEIGLKSLEGSATFYIFVNIEGYQHSSLDLAMYLLFKYHIAVVPGTAYGESTKEFIRIGVGAESMNHLLEAIRTIKKVIINNEFDDNVVNSGLQSINIEKFDSARKLK